MDGILKRRVFVLILAITLVISMTPMFALQALAAQAEQSYDNSHGRLSDGTQDHGSTYVDTGHAMNTYFTGQDVSLDIDYSVLNSKEFKPALQGYSDGLILDVSQASAFQMSAKVGAYDGSGIRSQKTLQYVPTNYYPYGENGFTFTDGDNKIDLAKGDSSFGMHLGGHWINDGEYSWVSYNVKLPYHTVTYSLDGQTGVDWATNEHRTIEENGTIKGYKFDNASLDLALINPNAPTKEVDGETWYFSGWSRSSGDDATVITSLSSDDNENITLYPVFSQECKVTFDLNDEELSNYNFLIKDGESPEFAKIKDVAVTPGESVTAPDTVFTNDGDEVKEILLDRDLSFESKAEDGVVYTRTFDGWSTDPSGMGAKFDFTTAITKNITLYAQWKKTKNHSVTFNMNQEDADTALDGKTFVFHDGTDESAEEVTELSKMVPHGSVVEEPSYFLKGQTDEAVFTDGVTYETEKATYAFSGWSTKADGSTGKFDIVNGTINADLTLYAQWTKVAKVNVTYDLHAPSDSGLTFVKDDPAATTLTRTAKIGDLAEEPVPVYLNGIKMNRFNTQISFVHQGANYTTTYTFAGWNTRKDGSGTSWNFNDSRINGETTLFAQWDKVNNYKVTFQLNAGDACPFEFVTGKAEEGALPHDKTKVENVRDGELVAEPKAYVDGASKNFNSKLTFDDTANKVRYVFKGWNTKKDGTGDDWNFNDVAVTKNTTIYAQWTKINLYDATFDTNLKQFQVDGQKVYIFGTEEEYEVIPAAQLGLEDGSLLTMPKDPTNSTILTVKDSEGNIKILKLYFNGWNTEPNGSGSTWRFKTDTITADTTLYAQWDVEKYYYVSFSDNLGDNEALRDYVYASDEDGNAIVSDKFKENQGVHKLTEQYVSSDKVPVPVFNRVDYTMEGWYMDAATSTSKRFDPEQTLKANGVDAVAADSTITLYAKWVSKYLNDNDTDLEIATKAMTDATYADYYSDYVKAFTEDQASKRIFRNFILVNDEGKTVGVDQLPANRQLPAGLHLNKRTGEIYGVPLVTGDFNINVRMANDEGKWISNPQMISIHVNKASLSGDLYDRTQYNKIYGEYDPLDMYDVPKNLGSQDLGEENPNCALVSGSKAPYYVEWNEAGNQATIGYDYEEYIVSMLDAQLGFDPAKEDADEEARVASLSHAPDIDDPDLVDLLEDSIKIGLDRVKGEDAGKYKRYFSVFEQARQLANGMAIDSSTVTLLDTEDTVLEDNYTVDKGALGNQNTKDAEEVAYADEYFLTINTKPNVTFEGQDYTYGDLIPGSEVQGLWNGNIVNAANGNVNNDEARGVEVGIEDTGKASVGADRKYLSGAGKLKANAATTLPVYTEQDMMLFSASNSWSQEIPSVAGSDTTANYDLPRMTMFVNQKELGAASKTPKEKVTVYKLNQVKLSDVNKLAYLTGVLKGDKVSINFKKAGYLIDGKTYDYNGAITALNKKAEKPGDYSFVIILDSDAGVLTGADALNYRLNSEVKVTLHVVKPVLVAQANSKGTKSLKLSWNSVPGASKYVVYGISCRGNGAAKKLKTTTSLSYTKGKLKKHSAYRFTVKAYAKNGKWITSSMWGHGIVTKTYGKKVATVTKVTLSPTSKSLAAGASLQLKSKLKVYKGKKCLSTNHEAKYRYVSTDPTIASVSSSGKVKAVSKGTCRIYVQAVSGKWASTQIVVK